MSQDNLKNPLNDWDLKNLHLANHDEDVYESVDLNSNEGEAEMDHFFGDWQKTASVTKIDLGCEDINDFFSQKRNPRRFWVKSASDLKRNGFIRIGNSSKLIRKSTKDLWELKKDGNGEYYIEEQFDDGPLTDTV